MKIRYLGSLAGVLGMCALSAWAGEPQPWRNPRVFERNRLPARAVAVPCDSAELALEIARGEKPRTASKWLVSLNGTWNFKWKHAADVAVWEKESPITVPGCWQLQGPYDPPNYTNTRYPIAGYVKGDPTAKPPKSFTSYYHRTPVGLYSRTFTLPADWSGRRTVIHFGGVSSALYVRVNGKEVGYSEDSRLPAEFDLTAYLVPGENTLEVEVFKHSDGSYLEDQDFWRLSGIYRDVWLVSEQANAAKDLVVEATLSADYKTGTLVVKDENGQILLEKTYADPKLWDAGEPNLYYETVAFTQDGQTDWRAVAFGFRTIEIKDAVVYVNGKRILVKGVNRHEMSPKGGYAVTEEDMKKDIEILKKLGVNAVRTCHYPDDPLWYELCDRAGIYVCCEANVEAHGVDDFYSPGKAKYLPKNPRYHDAIVSRGVNMVKTFRNHPSIIFWSLGNESGDGPAMADEYVAMRKLDATRPIQYEGAMDSDHSDIKCPMYWSPGASEHYVANNPKKPYILCEYSHAMGNSSGDFAAYWKLAEKYPSFQGGFIWDYADQAIFKTDARGTWLAYGGDFGDKPNDDNFNCNGIVDALRNWHPGAYEVQAVYGGKLEPTPAPAFAAQELPDTAGGEPSKKEFKINLWRAPTDNDRGWNMGHVSAVWKEATKSQTMPEGVAADLKATDLPDGRTLVTLTVTVPENMPPLPRVGVMFTIPADYTQVTWEGRGPHENYADRRVAADFGTYSATIGCVSGLVGKSGTIDYPADRLNPDNYSEPGEQGYRTDCRRVQFKNAAGHEITVTALNAPFGFNAWPYSQTALEKARHQWDLKADKKSITVNIDAVQMGVGGDDSWGAKPHAEYIPGAGRYVLQFVVSGKK